MILFENEDEVIEAYKEIGSPLEPNLISDLDQVDADLRDKKWPRGMMVVNLKCRLCNHKQVVIAPSCLDDKPMECAGCGEIEAEIEK